MCASVLLRRRAAAPASHCSSGVCTPDTIPSNRHELVKAHYNFARALRDTGRLPEAESACRSALDIETELVADSSTVPGRAYAR